MFHLGVGLQLVLGLIHGSSQDTYRYQQQSRGRDTPVDGTKTEPPGQDAGICHGGSEMLPRPHGHLIICNSKTMLLVNS